MFTGGSSGPDPITTLSRSSHGAVHCTIFKRPIIKHTQLSSALYLKQSTNPVLNCFFFVYFTHCFSHCPGLQACIEFQKYHIPETLNLSTCAESSTDTPQKKHVRCNLSCFTCNVSCVTCHQRQQPQTLPLLTPLLCIVGWLTKTEPKNSKHV